MSGPDLTRLQGLLAEQAALRRVATMVAGSPPAPALFDQVCQELGDLLEVTTTDMIRFEDERFATVVGSWTGNDTPSFPVGERIPVEGESVTAKLYRSGRPERGTVPMHEPGLGTSCLQQHRQAGACGGERDEAAAGQANGNDARP